MKKYLLLSLGFALAATPAVADLELYYTFDNDTVSPGGIADNSGNDRDGSIITQTGATSAGFSSSNIASVFTGGASLDLSANSGGSFPGATSYVAADTPGYTGALGNQRTISAWINPAVLDDNVIVSYGAFNSGAGTGEKYTFRMDEIGSSGEFGLRLEIAGGAIVGNTAIAADEWTHVALVQDGSTLGDVTFYVDGVADTLSSTSSTTINTVSGTDVLVGAELNSVGSTNKAFEGLIDDVALWSDALSGDAIADIAATGVVPEPAHFAALGGLLALGVSFLRRRRRA
jgi:hypothetical protein